MIESRLLPIAKADVLEGISWFDRIAQGLGDNFLDEFYNALERIKSNPEHFAIDQTGYRPCRLNRFTAVVYFKLHDNIVIVTGVCISGADENQLKRRG